MPVVSFTPNLKRFYPDLKSINIEAESIQEMLKILNDQHPGIQDYIVDEQYRLRKHVNIFIGENMIKDREGLSDPILSDDKVYIMQALSGG